MRRRDLLLTTFIVSVFPTSALAQTLEKVWRVGLLAPTRAVVDIFRRFTVPELANLGFVEGQNLTLLNRSADGDYERLSALARELVSEKPDVIVASASTTAIRAARAATSTIPIVLWRGGPSRSRLGRELCTSRPKCDRDRVVEPRTRGQAPGDRPRDFPLMAAHAVLFLPRARNSPNERAVQAAADRLGLEILFVYAGPEEYEAAFAAIRAGNAEAIAVMSNPVFLADAGRLAELALKAGLPLICEFRKMVEKGCLIGYAADLSDLRRRVAVYVARILRGTPADGLPIEEPTAFELTVNLKTARALGLEIPVSVLARADEVIE